MIRAKSVKLLRTKMLTIGHFQYQYIQKTTSFSTVNLEKGTEAKPRHQRGILKRLLIRTTVEHSKSDRFY